jgi:hypothetical protein
MERQSDGLRTGRLQVQGGTLRGDTGTDEVGEVRELGVPWAKLVGQIAQAYGK